MINTLLFFIFGTKTRDKEHGPAYPGHCPHCDNEVWWHLYEWRKWHHVFWIPLIPGAKTRCFLCPICGSHAELEASEFTEAQSLTSKVERYRINQLSPEALEDHIREFETAVGWDAEPEIADETAAEEWSDVDQEMDRGYY